MQNTSHILMIRPAGFAYNAETAVNNRFQTPTQDAEVQQKALNEFDAFVTLLQQQGVDVTVVQDSLVPHTPDSVFPNNWISFHEDGSLILYPMFAENRRKERKQQVLDTLKSKFRVNAIIDLSYHEQSGKFLEGTGSMVLDRENKIAYASLSSRTNLSLLQEWCEKTGYRPIPFTSVDESGVPIYHTNVMMCVADSYAVICLDAVTNAAEKQTIINTLQQSGKRILSISYDQLNHFAGNMLQVQNREGKKLLVMSSQAWNSLTKKQQTTLQEWNPVLHAAISTIETNGGGSARCMMAEIFLPG